MKTVYYKGIINGGLRVLAEEMTEVRSISLGVWIKAGSRNESARNNGISHLLEHLMFKGTTRRTAKQIAEELDAVGGHLEAFTSREYTCYFAKVLSDHLPLAIDILSDILLHSLLDSKDIEKEKMVVAEEIKMFEDAPDELVHDIFIRAIWNRHPLGLSILGDAQSVKALRREDILSYYKERYLSNQVIIAAAGNLKYKRFVTVVESAFNFREGKVGLERNDPPKVEHSLVTIPRDLEQIHFCLGTKGLPYDHEDRYALYLLNTIFGGSMSSRLFQEIREKRALAYEVYSYQSSYKGAGLFTVYVGTSPDKFYKVVDIILKEIEKLGKEGIKEAELKRAKEQMKGNFLLSLEDTTSRMSRLAKSEFYFGRVHSIEEILKSIDKVTKDDIFRVISQLFGEKRLTMATVGPIKDTKALEERMGL